MEQLFHDWDASHTTAAATASLALISLIVALLAYKSQATHNRLSVTPIPRFGASDYTNLISVNLRNRGSGPLLIRNFQAFDELGNRIPLGLEGLVTALPDYQNTSWSTFNTLNSDRVISPRESVTLVSLELNPALDTIYIAKIRERLGSITLKLYYTDIYQTDYTPHMKSLSWFHR